MDPSKGQLVKTGRDQNTVRHRYEYTSSIRSKPQTLIVLYEQPKVVIVRHYTRTMITHVNPEEYRKKFDRVLLDTSTLLEWTRRLNIQDNMIAPPRMQ